MSLGTLVVDEKPYPVVRVYLAEGRVFFIAQLRSPRDGELTIHPGDQAALFAPDGTQVMACRLMIKRPQTAKRGGVLTIELPLAVDEILGSGKWL